MELYYTFSIFIVLASWFAYLNLRFLKLPTTIGIMVIAVLVSIGIRLLGDQLFPEATRDFFKLISQFDFDEVLMGAMLNFLLFAGALHINIADLREHRLAIMLYSTVSVVLSAFFIAGFLFYICPLFGVSLPFIYCLLFGTLISPTDPIVVLSVLKQVKVPKSIETKITGESLFNDGVAVVMFAVVLRLALSEDVDITFLSVSKFFAQEVIGGVLVGFLLGYSASHVMKKIDDYKVTVLITLALVMGGFLLTKTLHVSSPLAMVIAGLVIGNYGKKVAMNDETQDYLTKFWELIDEILNAILFMFIGFELLLLPDIEKHIWLALITILVVLFSRMLSILIPYRVFSRNRIYTKGSLIVLVWGGIRGGVSIALVLSLPYNEYKEMLLEITYIVVLFSIVVQGLSIGKVAKTVLKEETSEKNLENPTQK
ncbi:sodium:proton antiporter [Flavobacterium sp. NKUCC04_CG]|uniref:cation:proton antiporter n=1 Tax=Flavobacterium sp. NKUCC04_CG TaxID=2842121 RepID=UPI001C5B6022|nr:sodium:proton antiporter [Flavobacterium sp. NKUCC04_CG]MBW3517668.1 sodium:proton antiporter [Flavobacterium sp. NKUCC04_CG]